MNAEVEAVCPQTDHTIHLYVPNAASSEPVIPVRWCLCKKTLEVLRAKNVKNPHLLLVVLKSYLTDPLADPKEIARYLVSLDQMMQYIQFTSPGCHTILATVVWDPGTEHFARFRRKILSKNKWGHYELSILERKDLVPQWTLSILSLGQATLEVDVSKDFFAKEPVSWLARWVDYFGWPRAKDQCQFRRRCIFAFTVQPIALFLFGILAVFSIFCKLVIRWLIAAFQVSIGMREVDFAPLIHPLSREYETSDIFANATTSIFRQDRRGKQQPLYIQALMPLPWIFAYVATVLLLRISYGRGLPLGDILLHAVFWVAPTALILVLFFASCRLLNFLTSSLARPYGLFDPIKQKLNNIGKAITQRLDRIESNAEERRRRAETRQFEHLYDELEPIRYRGTTPPTELDALPKKRQTIRLRYARLKAKVCKPFVR